MKKEEKNFKLKKRYLELKKKRRAEEYFIGINFKFLIFR
jgi:hypothetical protein